MITPYMVNEQSMYGTGQFPKFKEDVFQLTDERNLTLIPTAEVPLTNYYANEILDEAQLPITSPRLAHHSVLKRVVGSWHSWFNSSSPI